LFFLNPCRSLQILCLESPDIPFLYRFSSLPGTVSPPGRQMKTGEESFLKTEEGSQTKRFLFSPLLQLSVPERILYPRNVRTPDVSFVFHISLPYRINPAYLHMLLLSPSGYPHLHSGIDILRLPDCHF